MYFFGWGFYILGDDDTLEHKLTGQPAKPRVIGGLSRGKPSHALPQQAEGGGDYRSSTSSPSEREVTSAGHDSVVVIDIEPCDEDVSSETCNADNGDKCGGDRWAGLRQWFSRVLLSPNIIATSTGVAIAMIAPLQKMLFDNPRAILRPLGAALEVRHCPWEPAGAHRKYEKQASN